MGGVVIGQADPGQMSTSHSTHHTPVVPHQHTTRITTHLVPHPVLTSPLSCGVPPFAALSSCLSFLDCAPLSPPLSSLSCSVLSDEFLP